MGHVTYRSKALLVGNSHAHDSLFQLRRYDHYYNGFVDICPWF